MRQIRMSISVKPIKALAGERGYQTLINDTLRNVEADLRRGIREELAQRRPQHW